MKNNFNTTELKDFARGVRKHILKMVHTSNSSHVGSALSTVEMITYLYVCFMENNNPKDLENDLRDRFLLSKGHACTAVYATLAELGYFDKKLLDDYSKDGSILMSHISSEVPGVEFSTGSLGHALPVAVGMATLAKRQNRNFRVIVLMSDGELNEGSNWEAFMMAKQLKLDNLYMAVDMNGIQALGNTSDILDMEPLVDKLVSFGLSVQKVNGHDFDAIHYSFGRFNKNDGKPKMILASTTKGKGVSFMESKVEWHYRSPNEEHYKVALLEIEKAI